MTSLDRPRVKRPASRLRKVVRILIALGVVFGVLLGGLAIYANFYVHKKFNKTHDPGITAIDPLPAGHSYNILVLGSDRRDVVDKSERGERQFRGGGGNRADTILLLHVPADQKSAVILSFPRDLRVHIPGHKGFEKINAAYNGGPNLMIRTIKSLTGLSINHYIEVNFASFQKIVDAVGGVRLCPKRTYDDKQSGLIITHAGCQNFDGKLALAWVRMRKQDPKGDFGRIDRQQQFIRILMQKVKGIGFLTDIPRLFRVADAVSKGVVTDKNLELKEIRGIANKIAGFQQSNVDFRVVPSFGKYIRENGRNIAYVVARQAEAKALYEALRTDSPLPGYGKTAASLPEPKDVTVRILNATGTAGLAAGTRARLVKLGYVVRSIGDNPRPVSKTVIVFQPGDEAKANLINDEFPEADVRESTSAQTTDIVLILGADQATASPGPGG